LAAIKISICDELIRAVLEVLVKDWG